MLLHCGGMQLQDIYFTLKGDLSKYDDAEKALTQYFQHSINVPFERHVFRNVSQRDDETIEQFITRLKQKAETCEFTKVEEHIRDQIIEKCSSNVLCQKFLEKGKDLNLEMLREIARSYETAVAQIENFAEPEEVKQEEREKVNRLLKKSSAGRFANFNKPKSYNQEKCFRCGKTGHRAKNLNCPARNLCDRGKSLADDLGFLFALNAKNQIEKRKIFIGDVEVEMLIDSGATCNILDRQLLEFLKKNSIKCKCYFTEKKIYAYGSKEPLNLREVLKQKCPLIIK